MAKVRAACADYGSKPESKSLQVQSAPFSAVADKFSDLEFTAEKHCIPDMEYHLREAKMACIRADSAKKQTDIRTFGRS